MASQEHLQAGFECLKRLGHLRECADVAAALASPYAALVRMHASLIARGVQAYPATHQRPAVVAPEAPPQPAHRTTHRLPAYDHKRAAAGDLDD